MHKSILIPVVFFCFNLNSQVIQKFPFKEIYINEKLVYNDSVNFSKHGIQIWYCDTNGLAIDTCQGLFLVNFGKFKFIIDNRLLDSSGCIYINTFTKLEISKVKMSEWNSRIRHRNKIRFISYYSPCSGAWYSLSIRKGETKVLHMY